MICRIPRGGGRCLKSALGIISPEIEIKLHRTLWDGGRVRSYKSTIEEPQNLTRKPFDGIRMKHRQVLGRNGDWIADGIGRRVLIYVRLFLIVRDSGNVA